MNEDTQRIQKAVLVCGATEEQVQKAWDKVAAAGLDPQNPSTEAIELFETSLLTICKPTDEFI